MIVFVESALVIVVVLGLFMAGVVNGVFVVVVRTGVVVIVVVMVLLWLWLSEVLLCLSS